MGGSIFWKTREIGLPSYSKICTLWMTLIGRIQTLTGVVAGGRRVKDDRKKLIGPFGPADSIVLHICTVVCINSPPPPLFGLKYEGAIGQSR